MRVALDRFFAQLDQSAFGECAEGLIIGRDIAQQLRRRHWFLQFGNRFQQFGLTWRAFPQIVDLISVDLREGVDKKLFFPTDLGPPNHLR